MRENLTSGSMWQGMETRQGDGTEALSQETKSNGSATPKSRRHPLTLPADSGFAAGAQARFARNGAIMEKVFCLDRAYPWSLTHADREAKFPLLLT